MKLDTETVSDAKQRDGDASNDREDRINTVVNRPQLGFRNGAPLVGGYDYIDYPDRLDLADPQYADFLEDLAESPSIGNAADMVAELTSVSADSMLSKWLEAVERACQIYDIDVSNLETETVDNPVETVLEHDIPDSVLTAENSLLQIELYVAGLSVEEAATLLSEVCQTSVSPTTVRNNLTDVGFIDGRGESDGVLKGRGEINRPVDTTINVSDL